MTPWDDPDHLNRSDQTERVAAWRAEKSIWIERVQVEMMRRFLDRPVATTSYVMLCGVVLLGLCAMLSVAIGTGPLVVPGGFLFLTSTQAFRFMRKKSSNATKQIGRNKP